MSLNDRKHSDELLSCLGIECVEEKIQRARLRWFGHVERQEENEWVNCDWCGGQRCSEENMKELCQEGQEGYEYKGGNSARPLCLEEYNWESNPR